MKQHPKLELPIFVDCGELGESIEVVFTVNYYPATRDVMYLRNGDPGYPGDPAEVDILSAKINGVDVLGAFSFDSDVIQDKLYDAAAEATYEDAP